MSLILFIFNRKQKRISNVKKKTFLKFHRKVLAKIKEYSARPPFCVPYHPIIFNDIEVPIHAYHAYDAVMIYAKALTETLRDGYDPRNGTAIMERIRNRPYHSVLGFDVSP